MVELPKNKSKSAVLETLVVTGLFMSAFYFLFFEEIDDFLKRRNTGNSGGDTKGDSAPTNIDPPQIDPNLYAGRSEYCSDNNNPDSCVRGFPMPDTLDDLIFSDNGYISIITKPNTNPFGAGSRAMINVYRSGDNLAYYGRIDGVQDTYFENYEDVKNEIILTKNTYLKT